MTWDLFDQCPAKLLMCFPQCAFYHAPMPTVMKVSSSQYISIESADAFAHNACI